MSKHYLEPLFSPKTIAIFGAENQPNTTGYILFSNLIKSSFRGEIFAIHPQEKEIQGHPAYPHLQQTAKPIDLAIIATPANTIPAIMTQCGEHGVKTAIIVSGGFREQGTQGAKLQQEVLNIARKYHIRFLGPHSTGITRPSVGLNNGIENLKAGHLALISQSGSLSMSIMDWAGDVGFSAVVSLGASADLDFGDVLDYLAVDQRTQAVLLYIESLHEIRSFMSGLRAVSRLKPVVMLKSGRHALVGKAMQAHTGMGTTGDDAAFDAAIERAGVVRVQSLRQLVAAAKTLASRYRFVRGNRLAIITNGGGPGVIAADHTVNVGIRLAALSAETIQALNKELPANWSKSNPVDITAQASLERYHQAITLCLADANVDGVVVILTPQVMDDPLAIAKVVVELAEKSQKPILPCWMGGNRVTESCQYFAQARIPVFRTPEGSVEAFYYLASHERNQKLLQQTPASIANQNPPDVEGAKIIIENVLAERRKVLTHIEAKALLSAFHIPIVNTAIARSVNEAVVLAQTIGYPVALKVHSPNIRRKGEVGGIKLNVANAHDVREQYRLLMQQVQRQAPEARIEGITVERMSNKPNGRELVVKVFRDPIFGLMISFGCGGIMSEVLNESAISLPPLNQFLVARLIDKSRAARLLEQFYKFPPAKREVIEDILLRVSEMVCELPWLREMEINPLIADEEGAVVVDAYIVVDHYTPLPDRYAHMAICPYPTHLVREQQLHDGTEIVLRPIRPEDAELEQNFVRKLSEETRYFRFMQSLPELPPDLLVRFTQIDYAREMSLIITTKKEEKDVQIGVARYAINPDNESCEFAVVVADDFQGYGLGQRLMNALMDCAREKGLKVIEGDVLTNNHGMLKMMAKLGFTMKLDEEDRNLTRVMRVL